MSINLHIDWKWSLRYLPNLHKLGTLYTTHFCDNVTCFGHVTCYGAAVWRWGTTLCIFIIFSVNRESFMRRSPLLWLFNLNWNEFCLLKYSTRGEGRKEHQAHSSTTTRTSAKCPLEKRRHYQREHQNIHGASLLCCESTCCAICSLVK